MSDWNIGDLVTVHFTRILYPGEYSLYKAPGVIVDITDSHFFVVRESSGGWHHYPLSEPLAIPKPETRCPQSRRWNTEKDSILRRIRQEEEETDCRYRIESDRWMFKAGSETVDDWWRKALKR